MIAADATQLTVALRALLDNALNAIDSDGRVSIAARNVSGSSGEVEIVVHLETRGSDHVKEIIALMEADGLRVEEDT